MSRHEPSANLSERVRLIFNQRYYTRAAGSQRLSVFPGFSPVGIDIDRLRRYYVVCEALSGRVCDTLLQIRCHIFPTAFLSSSLVTMSR